MADDTMVDVQSSALDALTQLHAEMQREFHHNAVDLPVSVNLDDWIARLGKIIVTLRTPAPDLQALDEMWRQRITALAAHETED